MGKFIGTIITTLAIAVGYVVGGVVVAAIAAVAAGALTTALFSPKVPKPDASERQVRNSTPVRNYLYGTRRVFGSLILFETSATGSAVDVMAFLDGQAHDLRGIYMGDDLETLSGGIVQEGEDGRYKGGVVLAGINLGLPTETAFAPVISELPGIWTEDHRGDGVVSGYLIKRPVKAKKFIDVYPQGDNVELSCVFDGQYLFDPRDITHDPYDSSTWVSATPNIDNAALALLHYFIVRRGYDYATRILPQIDKWIHAADVCDEVVATSDEDGRKRYTIAMLYSSIAQAK